MKNWWNDNLARVTILCLITYFTSPCVIPNPSEPKCILTFATDTTIKIMMALSIHIAHFGNFMIPPVRSKQQRWRGNFEVSLSSLRFREKLRVLFFSPGSRVLIMSIPYDN